MDSLDQQSKQEIERFIEAETSKAKLHQAIHELSSVCWKKCIAAPIRSGALDSGEQACLQNCVGRWVDMSLMIAKGLSESGGR